MVTRGVASNARRMARMLYAVLVGDSLPLAGPQRHLHCVEWQVGRHPGHRIEALSDDLRANGRVLDELGCRAIAFVSASRVGGRPCQAWRRRIE